jgi:hypothetical protein
MLWPPWVSTAQLQWAFPKVVILAALQVLGKGITKSGCAKVASKKLPPGRSAWVPTRVRSCSAVSK